MSFVNVLLRELAQQRRWGRNQNEQNDGVDPNERFFTENDARIKNIKNKKINIETKRIIDDAALKNLSRLVRENNNVKGISFKGWYNWGARRTLETNEIFNRLMYGLVENDIERLEMHNLKLLNGENYVVISESFKVLSKLTLIDFRGFSPIHLQFSGICSTNLKEIRFNRCKLTDKSCEGISAAIKNNPNLKKINLASNIIGDKGSILLFNAIAEGNLKKLEFVSLKDNVLETCTSIVSFATNSKIKILKVLELNRNKIGEYSIVMIPKLHLFRVRNLSLRDIKLGYLATQRLIKFFGDNQSTHFLKTIDISNNGISSKNTLKILKSLTKNVNIEGIKMTYISYDCNVDRALANLIQHNRHLKSIEIGQTEGGNMWSTPHVTMYYKSLVPDALRVNLTLHTLRLTGLIFNSMNLNKFCKDSIYTDIFRVIDLKSCLYYGDYDLNKFALLSKKNKNKSKRIFGEIILPNLHPQIRWRRRREERELANQQQPINLVIPQQLNVNAFEMPIQVIDVNQNFNFPLVVDLGLINNNNNNVNINDAEDDEENEDDD